MMSWCKANAWRTLLVWMAIATLVQPQSLLAVEANPQSISHRMAVPRDVVLTEDGVLTCLLYTSPSPRDRTRSRMPSYA